MEPVETTAVAALKMKNVDLPVTSILADDSLMVKGLPQLSIPCATITITAKHVLKKAAKKLGVSIHGYEFTSLGGDEITASVKLDVPPHKENPFMKTHEFYGEWSRCSYEAKNSACLAALKYLKDENLIVVHDTNFADMKKYKRKFETEHFWSSVLYDRAASLKDQLSAKACTTVPSHLPAVHRSPKVLSVEQNISTPASRTAETSNSSTAIKGNPLSQCHARKALFLEK